MKLLRIFSRLFLLFVALAAILVAFVFVPSMQTWVAQWALSNRPDLHLSLESLAVGLGKVEINEIRFEHYGAVLTLPLLEARLPMIAVAKNHQVFLQSLVAKGWTLDLRFPPEQTAASTPVPRSESEEKGATVAQSTLSPAESVVRVFSGLLSGWRLPYDVSAEGIDLEGDVLVPVGPGKERARVHLTVKGGGLASGREGVLAVDAGGSFLRPQIVDLAAHGSLAVAMDSSRSINRVEVKTMLSAKGGSLPEELNLLADVCAVRAEDEETYSVDLSRGDRHLVTLLAHLPRAKRQLSGTWKIDLQSSDLGLLVAERSFSELNLAGEGVIDADTAFSRLHAVGRLSAIASHLGRLSPALEPLGRVALDTHFDMARSERLVTVAQLDLSLTGPRPVAVAQSLQPFNFDEVTGTVTVADSQRDWMEGSLSAFPWSWLSTITGGLIFTGGEVAGEFVLRASKGEFALRGIKPFTAKDVSVESGGSFVAQKLDLTLSLLADKTAQGWHVQFAPVMVSSAGQQLAILDAKISQLVGAEQPIVIAGKWSADLEALSSRPVIPSLRATTARSASGDFSANLGLRTKWEGNLTVAEHEPDHSIKVKLSADIGADRSISFRAPVEIVRGSNVSVLSTQGTWAPVKAGHQVSVRLAGKELAAEHLRLLTSSLGMILGSPSLANFSGRTESAFGAQHFPVGTRDTVPFWGDVVGRVYLAFDRLKWGGGDLQDVRANLKLDHGSLRLETGQYVHPDHHRLGEAQGLISFDPAAQSPYSLKVTFDDSDIDGALLFGEPAKGEDPAFHGRFSVASTLTGTGINLSDLVGRTQQEFQLKSKGGIVRLLKTRVTGLTPDRERPIANAAETMGTLVAKLAGMKRKSLDSGEVHLSKAAESVIDFTYQVSEIGYDEINITAARGPDGTVRLVDLAMLAPDEHVTGSGEITYNKDVALQAEPLNVELKFGFRGKTAELLANAGLLLSEKDNLGYAMLKQSVHFGGTLQHIDESQWHDLLVEAATRKPDSGKKDLRTPATKTDAEGGKP